MTSLSDTAASPAIAAIYAAMPAERRTTIQEIGRTLRAHGSFQIITHIRPDGDALGSALALHHLAKSLGKESRVFTAGPVGDQFDFMPDIERVATVFQRSWRPDVTIYIDCGDLFRAADEDLRLGATTVNIDHHLGNPDFGDLNYVDPSASSAGEQVYHIARLGGLELTREVATCLYVAIVSDTGNFRYSNTAPHVFEIASECGRVGAKPSEIAALLFDRRSPGTLMLAGRVLERIKLECDGRLCWSELRQDDYHDAGGESAEPEGVVGELRGVRGVDMAVLLHETEEGFIRASFRSRAGFDCQGVAKSVGGGGHMNASGVFMRKPYAEGREEILRASRAIFGKNGQTAK